MSSTAIDNLIALRILHMLVTPFVDTAAFRLGIIDHKGNVLRKAVVLHTQGELNAYTMLHRLVFRLKRIIEKVPVINKKFLTYAAAFALVKEHLNDTQEPMVSDFEGRMISEDVKVNTNDVEFVEHFFSPKYIMPFRLFEEDGAAPASAPANNIASTPGIDVPSPTKLFNKKLIKRNNKK